MYSKKLDEIHSLVLDCSVSGYYKWKKQGRPVIDLLIKYFTKEDLEQFLETGSIKKLDLLDTVLNSQSQNYLQFYKSFSGSLFDSPQKLLYFKSLNIEGKPLLSLKKLNVGDFERDYELFLSHYISANVDSYINSQKPDFLAFYDYCHSNGLDMFALLHKIDVALAPKLSLDRNELTKQKIKAKKNDLVAYFAYSSNSQAEPLAEDDLQKILDTVLSDYVI